MKNTKIVLGSIIWLTLMACSKDDGPSIPDPKPDPVANRPPAAFGLIEVTNGATKVDLMPTFSWNVSTDPDGDAVTYDLLFDTESVPTTVLASNLTSTTFKVTERLHLTTPYYWKVVAKDGKGNSVASITNSFTTRTLNFPTAPLTAAALTKGVAGHTSVVFQNKLWAIGGIDGQSKNDVWYSDNGSDWVLSPLSDKPFAPRWGHTIAVFDDKLWVIGGFDQEYLDDVWYSENGAIWSPANSLNNFPITGRAGHATVVFNNKLWVIGGYDGINYKNDIWHSTDGAYWTRVIIEADFSPRYEHTAVVFDGKIWIIGGRGFNGDKNDIWYSSDGTTWTRATIEADFSPRSSHTTVVFDNKLWMIAGRSGNVYYNDLWYSEDGVTWETGTEVLPFSPRMDHTTVVFDEKIWVIGGFASIGSLFPNDVWALD